MRQQVVRSWVGGTVGSLLLWASFTAPVFAQETHAKAAAKPAEGHAPASAAGGHGAGSQIAIGREEERKQIENPLELEPALIFWTFIVFIGLMTLLGKYAWKPLIAALHDREHSLEKTLEETERARTEAQQALAEHRALMARASDDVRAILEKAKQDAVLAAEQIVKAAQAEADASKQRAVRDISTARDQALTEIWTKSAEVAVSVAGKVLSKQLGDDEHRRLLDAAILELPSTIASTTGSPAGSHA